MTSEVIKIQEDFTNERDILQKYMVQITQMENDFDMEVIIEKRRTYQRFVQKIRLNQFNPIEIKEMKDANSILRRYYSLKKKISIIKNRLGIYTDDEDTDDDDEDEDEDAVDVEELSQCDNCHRCQYIRNDTIMNSYNLTLHSHERNVIKKRQAFRFVNCSTTRTDNVILCHECSCYLTDNTREAKEYKNIWPSFIWYIINNKDVQHVYGIDTWKFIPKEWRYWWLSSISDIFCFENATIDFPYL